MNSVKHAQISVRRWGGRVEDYLAIHDFIDHTKALCADARHRILHTHWALNHIVVPIFGETLVNSDGKSINVKDMCERDHLLADYHNKFIPTLSDFVEALSDEHLPYKFEANISALHSELGHHSEISRLLLSPLSYTGRLKSLLLTHNSWFLCSIVPRIFNTPIKIQNFALDPASLFNAMEFQLWMDNGVGVPGSASQLRSKLIESEFLRN